MQKRKYEVGYGRPPKLKQFKPGRSGNPKGRPKASRTLEEAMRKLLTTKHSIVQNGQQKNVPFRELILLHWCKQAMSGNKAAINFVLDQIERSDRYEQRKQNAKLDKFPTQAELLAMTDDQRTELYMKTLEKVDSDAD